MNNDALWSILLLIAALLIVVVEFFLPSGGLLAILALTAFIASIVLGFKTGVVWGTSLLVVALLALPATIFGMLRILPYTPMGRRMFRQPIAPLPDPRSEALSNLVGRVGVAHTELLPSGLIEIDGERMEAIAPGIAIPQGAAVEVIRVSGNQIYVIPTDRSPDRPPVKEDKPLMDQSLKDLGLEELDRPLG